MIGCVVLKKDVFKGIDPGVQFLHGIEVPVHDQVQQAPEQKRCPVDGQVRFGVQRVLGQWRAVVRHVWFGADDDGR